jgi:hypothetical protein
MTYHLVAAESFILTCLCAAKVTGTSRDKSSKRQKLNPDPRTELRSLGQKTAVSSALAAPSIDQAQATSQQKKGDQGRFFL